MQLFMETPGCQRVVINYCIDSRENRMVCEEGEALCVNCAGQVRRQVRVLNDVVIDDETLVKLSPHTLVKSQTSVQEEEQKPREEIVTQKRSKRRRIVSIMLGCQPQHQSETEVSGEQEEFSQAEFTLPSTIGLDTLSGTIPAVQEERGQTSGTSTISPFKMKER
jgi:hypothetical protein